MSDRDFPVLNLEDSITAEPPVLIMTKLILSEALRRNASEIRIMFDGEQSDISLHFVVEQRPVKGIAPPIMMYTALCNLLCQRASIAYYEKGPDNGTLKTANPESRWTMESVDLQRGFQLLRH